MVRITISCPTTWWERCTWITKNCPGCEDLTNWGMWQVGMDNIYISVEDRDATMYYLRWA